MTEASLVCSFAAAHPDNWAKLLKERRVTVKEEGPYAILNYAIAADFSDPIVQECRGMIIDTEDLTVACWPFRKFGNHHESYVDEIDWSTAVVQEKVDGSIAKLWHDDRRGEWRWSSNSCIDASDASLSSGATVADAIAAAPESHAIDYGSLNPSLTYIFEVTGPLNEVVVRYEEPHLTHTGTRDRRTGSELSVDIGVPKPAVYPLRSLGDCIAAASALNHGGYPTAEGFVVVDAQYRRVKVKAPEYLLYHHAVGNAPLTKERAVEILSSDDLSLPELMRSAPALFAAALSHYSKELEAAKARAVEVVRFARAAAARGASRKDVALSVQGDPLASFAFMAIDSDGDPEAIVSGSVRRLSKVVKDYELTPAFAIGMVRKEDAEGRESEGEEEEEVRQ